MKLQNLICKTVVFFAMTGMWSCMKFTQERHRLPMKEEPENSLLHAWQSKNIQESYLIADMEDTAGWSVEGIGHISFTTDRFKDGARSLRFSTPMRDEEQIKRLAKESGKEQGRNGGSTGPVLSFHEPRDWSKYNRVALWIYVHPTEMRTYSLSLSFNCEDAPSSITDPRSNTVIQGLVPGQWNYVLWEIANLRRDKVTRFAITQGTRGNDPGTNGIVTYDIDKIELQLVDADKYEGWEVAKGKIAFSHVGYYPGQHKTALANEPGVSAFKLVDALTGDTVLSKSITPVINSLGIFQVLDFSEVHSPGKYFLKVGAITSRPFWISDTIWREPVKKAINFFYAERCGTDVPGIHGVCHKDWQVTHNGVTKIINGGWHDAGDLSQSFYRTGMSVYSMLKMVDQQNLRGTDPDLTQLVLDEALWGLDWLLKSRFGDGYRLSSSTMRIYTDGVIGTDDDVITPAKNIPWESFLAAAIEARAYHTLKENRPELAAACLKAAEEDWEAAANLKPDWENFDNPRFDTHPREGNTYLTVSWGIISSLHLYQATGKQPYYDRSLEYGRMLLNLQERKFVSGIPITGYFYTGPGKTSICYYSHAEFDESAILALTGLCAAFPDHPEWIDWYAATAIYADYFMKRGAEYAAPYYMLPATVYRKSDFMRIEDPYTREGMLKQFREGIRFTDDYYLRLFPVWTNQGFHGNTGVQLSKTLALTAAVQLRNDLPGEEIVNNQMQWIFGGNPFAQSLMYGEGYDYAPLYGPNPGDIVGALPVGMDCMNNDAPYWDGCNIWTYKEIWVFPVNRFLWDMAYLGMPGRIQGKIRDGKVHTITFQDQETDLLTSAAVDADSSFNIQLPAGNYRIEYGDNHRIFPVVSGGNYEMVFDPSNNIDISAGVKNRNLEQNIVQIQVSAEGKGTHDISLRIFNGKTTESAKTIDLGDGNTKVINWNVSITDPETPWIIVIIPDKDLTGEKELNGTMERTKI